MRILTTAVLILGILPAALLADNLASTACPDNTVAYYEANFVNSSPDGDNGPCANGILNFFAFQFQSSGTQGAVLSSNQIELSPLGPPLGQTGETGFTISALDANGGPSSFSVAAGQTATYVIDWFFQIDSGPYAGGASLGMDPPFGNASVTQEYCVDSFLSQYSVAGAATTCTGLRDQGISGNPPVQSLTVFATPDTLQNASITFNPVATNFADVRTIITLDGGPANPSDPTTPTSGFGAVTGSATIFPPNVAPEPGTLLLIPGGLVALAFLRKRTARQ
jgi:hypothetical protein